MTDCEAVQAIKDQGRTIAWLARELGMDRTTLTKKLRGDRPPLTRPQVEAIRRLTGLPMSMFPIAADTPVEAVA